MAKETKEQTKLKEKMEEIKRLYVWLENPMLPQKNCILNEILKKNQFLS